MAPNKQSNRNAEAERLDISEETLESMKKFFVNTSIPRLIEKRRKEAAEKEEQT